MRLSGSGAPFSAAAPGVISGIAQGELHYAFNFDNPDGVKLLTPRAFKRLQHHLGKAVDTRPPLEQAEREIDETLFRHGLVKAGGRYAARVSPPISLGVWLNIVDVCNLGCFYCYIPELQKRVDPAIVGLERFSPDDATTKLVVRRLIDFCRQAGIKRLNVKFAGGEPTLVTERIDRFCEELQAASGDIMVSFGMITNGVFDASKVLPTIRKNRIGISISIDGMARAHDRIRFLNTAGKRSGTWETAQANARRLIDAGTKPYFLYTVTPKNIGDLAAFAHHAHALGCGFRLSLERSSRLPDFETQRRTFEHLTAFYDDIAQTAPLDMRLERSARFAEWNLRRKKQAACSSCRSYFAIGSGGQVASCQMRLNQPAGDLRREPLAASLARFSQSPHSRKLQRPAEKVGGCVKCEFRFVCAGGCPQHTYEAKGELDAPSPWCYVYGSLAPKYVEACAIHLGRRATSAERSVQTSLLASAADSSPGMAASTELES